MANFQQAKRRAQKLTPAKVKKDFFNLIRTLEKELASINADKLFSHSKDIEDNPIGFYSAKTEEITGGRKRMGDPYDLKETGIFLNSIYAKVKKDSIFFGADDPKTDEVLHNLLTTNIFGLSDKDLNFVIQNKILPLFLDYLRNKIT